MIKRCIGNFLCHSDTDEISHDGRYSRLAGREGAS